MLSRFSRVRFLVTPWSVALQARQEYWSGLPCPPPGDLPDPGIEPLSLTSPALAGWFFTTSATWESHNPVGGGISYSQFRNEEAEVLRVRVNCFRKNTLGVIGT